MKGLFPGHFKESEKNLKAIWETCIFIFDANILLNLYRYSDSTRNEFLRILKKIKPRTWLPHRAAEEYLTNRLSVIDQQEKSYDDTVKLVNSLKSDLDNARQHPFVSQKTMQEVERLFEKLSKELSKNKETHTKRISNDEIKESILSIFSKSVGDPYEKEKLEELIVDGEERYKQKIPPGFKDSSKFSDSEVFTEKCRKYGDLIVWNQVIDKSINSKKPIVLVTDDKKDDWWEKFKGKTIGPRPELVKEFNDKTGNSFHMYQADRFLELARVNLDETVSNEIVAEIREVRRRDKIAQKRNLDDKFRIKSESDINRLMNELDRFKQKLMSVEEERHNLKNEIKSHQTQRIEISRHRKILLRRGENKKDTTLMERHISILDSELEQLSKKLELASMNYQEYKNHLMVLESELAHLRKINEQESSAVSWVSW